MTQDKARSISAYFQKDHQRLDKLFREYQSKKTSDFARSKTYFKEFMQGLLRHIAWEEEVLFPLFEEKTGIVEGGPTPVMRSEHTAIKEVLHDIHGMVSRGETETDVQETTLLGILTLHNQKEEYALYPMMDQTLADEEREAVFQRIKHITDRGQSSCCGREWNE